MPKKGYKQTKKHRKKLSIAHKGKNHFLFGKLRSERTKRKISKARKGQIPWNKGKKCPQLTGENNGMFGKIHSKEARKKMGLSELGEKNFWFGKKNPAQSERMKGKNHFNWQNGKSFEPYGPEFNSELKLFIRQRDNFTCQFCGTIENGKAHDNHHINYIHKDNRERNLILLCRSCNDKANFNRNGWQFLFETLMEIRYL